MSRLRRPRLVVAALAVYLTVHVVAGALHHHGPAPRQPAPSVVLKPRLHAPSTSPTGGDEGEDECLLCHVLHSARTAAVIAHVPTFSASQDQIARAVAVTFPRPVETATHPRAPPCAI